MTRVLVVLEGGGRWPSGIVRGLIYRDLLAQNGFSTTFVSRQPLREMDWIDNLSSVMRRVIRPSLQHRILNRATRASEERILSLARDVDVVYLSKVTSYPFVLNLCRQTNARVVYDFGDAVWLWDGSPDGFHEVLQSVDAVTTDNEITADYVRLFNSNCTVIPDAPPLEEFDKRRAEFANKPDDRINLGWVGTQGTAYNLYVIWEALEALFRRHSNLHLRLVGTGSDLMYLPRFEKVRFTYCPSYNQEMMIEEVFAMHIGLFPLQDVERCRVRGVLKATVYMSGEAVVLSSPVGQSVDLIQDGHNGMIAGSTQEWIDKIELLISDPDLRRRLAQNGLETVRSGFRVDQSFAKLKEVLLPSAEISRRKIEWCESKSVDKEPR